MNKKRLIIILAIGAISLLILNYFTERILFISEASLPEMSQFDVDKALNYSEFSGEEEMRKRGLIVELLVTIYKKKEDHWDEVERALEESDILEEKRLYYSDRHNQIIILYDILENGTHLFGYVTPSSYLLSSEMTKLYTNEFEIEKQRNMVEILREDLIEKKGKLHDLIGKRDITLRSQVWDLLNEINNHRYYEERITLLWAMTFNKLKKGAPLEMLPPWEEGEHYLKKFFRYYVWIGMYSTDKPDIDNYIGSFTTDEFTHEMKYYWEEALKRKKDTKSIRIKWTYISEEHKIVWEGNKNANEEWYTFAKYEERYVSPEYDGEPPEGFYTVVNMSSLDYPEFKQYYVMSYRLKSCLNGLI